MHEGQKKNTQLLEHLEKWKRKKKEVNGEKKRFTTELTAKKREITGKFRPICMKSFLEICTFHSNVEQM
jgi:hypothetical protein